MICAFSKEYIYHETNSTYKNTSLSPALLFPSIDSITSSFSKLQPLQRMCSAQKYSLKTSYVSVAILKKTAMQV
jgi:hypothetical protein